MGGSRIDALDAGADFSSVVTDSWESLDHQLRQLELAAARQVADFHLPVVKCVNTRWPPPTRYKFICTFIDIIILPKLVYIKNLWTLKWAQWKYLRVGLHVIAENSRDIWFFPVIKFLANFHSKQDLFFLNLRLSMKFSRELKNICVLNFMPLGYNICEISGNLGSPNSC